MKKPTFVHGFPEHIDKQKLKWKYYVFENKTVVSPSTDIEFFDQIQYVTTQGKYIHCIGCRFDSGKYTIIILE